MKKQWILYMLLLGFLSLSAQAQRSDAIFLSTESFLGNYTGFNLDLNYQFRQSYSIAIGLNHFSRKVEDYYFRENDYRHSVEDFHILVGKAFPSRKGGVRWNLALGIAKSHSSLPIGLKEVPTLASLITGSDENKIVTVYEENSQIAFIFNPKLELPISKVIGFSFSALYMTNDVKPVFGLGIGLIVGKLR